MTAQSQTNPSPVPQRQSSPQTLDLKLLPAPAVQQSTNPSTESAKPSTNPLIHSPRRRARNGRVARLPYVERDMVNRMIRDRIPDKKISGALEEHGYTVTPRNISNWRTRGGFKEWNIEMERALETRLLQDNLTEHLRKNDASQLSEVGLQLAATQLSQFLVSPEGQKQLATDPQAYFRTVACLCRIATQLQNLQKYRDDSAKELGHQYNPEHIKREYEQGVEKTREIYSAASLGECPHDPIIPRRNYMPKTR
jgi:hypothetical protein